MNISGSTPALRVAQAYGVAPKPVVSTVQTDKTDKTDKADEAVKAQGLRAVLSDEERAYFDQLASLGPITYGPSRKPGMVPEAPRGLRLDVRG
jgi:hypothetical protein